MFLTAARALAGLVSEQDIAQGRVYPPLSDILNVSARIATAVAEDAYREGLARAPRPATSRPTCAAGCSSRSTRTT